MGSTSWAITTNLAALFSMRVVMWFNPNFKTVGFLPSTFLLSALFLAYSVSLAFFSSLVSGEYFFKNFNKFPDPFLSKVVLN